MQILLQDLNPRQQEAVRHKDGPLLILAGAGSGKTTTMASRIAFLVAQHHVEPRQILGLSFTRKAAKELNERVRKKLKSVDVSSRGLTVATFHSLCVRILKKHAEKIGYKIPFTILDESDQNEILRGILKNIKIDDRKFDVDVLKFEISQAKSRFLKRDDAHQYFEERKSLGVDYQAVLTSVYPQYLDRTKLLNGFDFDDLIFQAVELLESQEEVRKEYRLLYRYILVDEYQDTNPTQFKLLSLLCGKSPNLCVVGDDDQSIYAWRGADSSHILQFSKIFPESKVIFLDQNYRSTTSILNVANEVISKNSNRYPKRLWSSLGEGEPLLQIIVEGDRGESEAIADEILKHAHDTRKNRPWKDFAILYRSNSQSRVFEESLRLRRIPYEIVGGMSFLDRKEVKDVLSHLKILVNANDDPSMRRALLWPSKGIGKGTIESVHEMSVQMSCSLFEAAKKFENSKKTSSSSKALESLNVFIQNRDLHLETLRTTVPVPSLMSAWMLDYFKSMKFKDLLWQDIEDPVAFQKKWENIEELAQAIGQFDPDEKPENAIHFLSEFLNTITLDPKDDREKKEDSSNRVTLMTLHSAKGLEYPIVFMVGLEEGLLPHQRTIDSLTDLSEERRLCYVGMTRAKELLILSRAKTRVRFGKTVPRIASRFLADIPKEHLLLRDDTGAPPQDELHEEKVKDFFAQMKKRLSEAKP